MNGIRGSITSVFDEVWRRTHGRLAGLTDAEYLWEPAPGGWTLRPDAEGRWHIDGEGGGGATPDPVPVATIAWRIGHIGLTFTDYGIRLFHGRNITLDDVEFPGTAAGGLEFLETAYYTHWREPLDTLPDERWWEPSGPSILRLRRIPRDRHRAARAGRVRPPCRRTRRPTRSVPPPPTRHLTDSHHRVTRAAEHGSPTRVRDRVPTALSRSEPMLLERSFLHVLHATERRQQVSVQASPDRPRLVSAAGRLPPRPLPCECRC